MRTPGASDIASPSGPNDALLGRQGECEALRGLLEQVLSGHSGVVVVRGEPGIGKTTLLDYLQARAVDCRTARAAGVEAEMELPFAGLHQLCAPFLDRAAELPTPQRDALATAFGISSGPPPDRFLVGLAVLTLVADVASEQPLVCVIDDVQWLDRVSAQVLAFVARRLHADPIAMVFATRVVDDADLRGLPELRLAGLDTPDAGALLDSVAPGRLDGRLRSRFIAESGGNPLALLELPRAFDADLPGGLTPSSQPVATQIENRYARQIDDLPPETRQLLLVAAVEPIGDVSLLWRAVDELGIGPSAAAPAEAAGLLSIRNRIRFRHPLLRSAVRTLAGADARQQAHRVLAEVIDAEVDPDRRAWHRALATAGHDEQVAAELQASAERARQRGGVAAEASFLERAVALTPDRRRRAERALAAAWAKLRAGAIDESRELLTTAEAGPLSALDSARANLLGAQVRFVADRGNETAPLLLAAARRLERLDPGLARDTYLEAISAAMFAGRLAQVADVEEVAWSARAAPPARPPVGIGDELLDGLAVLFTDGYQAAVPRGRAMLRNLRTSTPSIDNLRYLWLAAAAAADLWDDESWHLFATEHVRVARETGALSELPLALNSRALVHLYAGELGAAASLVAELRTIVESTGVGLAPYAAMGLAAWRGDKLTARDLVEANMSDAVSRGEGIGVSVSYWCAALLHIGHGEFDEALLAARQAVLAPRDLAVAKWGLTELVEAAVRVGEREVAAEAFRQLSELTSASGTHWALGVEARAGALLATDESAENLYREAVECLARTRMPSELARAHLVYGEWLQDQDRRTDARHQLRTSHEMFERIGATAFAERASRALRASGVTVSQREPDDMVDLTDQEGQIARLASDGLTNREIGAQLFLSPHTVEWHLRKVYRKLGIRSRKQLPERLVSVAEHAAQA